MTINYAIEIKPHNNDNLNDFIALSKRLSTNYPFFTKVSELKQCSITDGSEKDWYKKHWSLLDTSSCEQEKGVIKLNTQQRIPFPVFEALSKMYQFSIDIVINDDYENSTMTFQNFNLETQIFDEIMH